MKQLLPFCLALFFVLALQAQPRPAFKNPDIWVKPVEANQQIFMQVVKSDSVYNLKTNAVDYINYQSAMAWDTNRLPWRIVHKNTAYFEQAVFAVYHCSDSLNEYGIWHLKRDSLWHSSQTTRRFIKYRGATEYQNGNADMPVINTSMQAWPRSRFLDKEHTFVLGQSRMEDSLETGFSGLLAECLVYGQCPNRRQTAVIQTYLALKYGITLMKSDYVASSGLVLWDYKQTERYRSGIAGLGKDSLSGLDQKQSRSTSEPLFLSISAGQTAPNNRENPSVLQQGDYLLWGHDSAAMEIAGSATNIYPFAHPLLQRKWKIFPYGNMRNMSTEVVIRADELPDSAGTFRLAIDRSGTGNFESALIEYIPADSISPNNEVFFKNIKWDTDSSGSDLFTFAVGSSLLCDIRHPSCENTRDGKLDIEIIGGVSPYRYILTHTGTNQRRQWQGGQRMRQIEGLPVGRYILEAYDSENRYWKKEDIVLTSSLPENFGLAGTYHIAQGDTLILDAHTGNAFHYVWKKDGIVFDTTNRVELTLAGRYELTASAGQGCVTKEDIQVVVGNGELFPCEIYPNPTPGPYEIRVSLPEIMEMDIRIYTLNGVVLMNRHASGDKEYRFSGYMNNTGRYLVDVQTPIGRRQLVMIVKR